MLNVVSSKARGEASMSAKNGSITLVAGNSNPALAQDIAKGLGIELTKAVVRRFADMEIFVEIQENIRGSDMFILQSTSFPANDNLMELLIITDALRRASARRITAVVPYFGYARQDRKSGSRTPISAKLVANLISRAGVDRGRGEIGVGDVVAGEPQVPDIVPEDRPHARAGADDGDPGGTEQRVHECHRVGRAGRLLEDPRVRGDPDHRGEDRLADEDPLGPAEPRVEPRGDLARALGDRRPEGVETDVDVKEEQRRPTRPAP